MQTNRKIAVLCTTKNSLYATLPNLELFDKSRDARNFTGSMPVIAHPPCRSFGRFKRFANPVPGERDLAALCVYLVQKNGGVLEHPAQSSLWALLDLPLPGAGYDQYGGFSMQIDQVDYGHPCRKRTWLYICGVAASQLPRPAISFVLPDHAIGGSWKRFGRKDCPRAWRERTPLELAKYLVRIAQLCAPAGPKICPRLRRLELE